MSLIMSSELFKSSKNKSKILSTISNPINKELVKQLESYVKVSDLTEDDNSEESGSEDSKTNKLDDSSLSSNEKSNEGGSLENDPSTQQTSTSKLASFVSNDESDEPETASSSDSSDDNESTSDEHSDDPDNSNVSESTSINKTQIKSSTYVTADTVAKAVNELPGALNLLDDTKGVDYAAFKTNANNANEVWIYYDSEVDVSKILNSVVTYLLSSGYYYLQFNRVSRDDNALVFVVNWVSNYFNVKSVTDAEEK